MKNSFVFTNILLLLLAFALAGCPGPTITYTAKIGAAIYTPIELSKVEVFENMPQKGSYIELGEIMVEDELKCGTDEAFQEEKTLSTIEKLRKKHADLSKVTDIAMLELLAEAGEIERSDICALVPRFVRKEEKTNFVSVALMGTNQNAAKEKAAEIGANAIIKVEHSDWTLRGKPSGVGGDMAQSPSIKIGVRTTCTALKYEPPEEESKVVEEKVLEVVEDEKEEEEKAEEEKEEEKKVEKKPAKVEKKEEKPAKVEKKPAKVVKSSAIAEAEKVEKELAELEKAIKEKEAEQKDLKADIKKDKEELDALKKELAKKKKKAAKEKAGMEKKKAEEEKKAKLAAKKEAEEKAKKEDEEKAKKEAEEKAKKEAKKEEPEEKKEATDVLSEKDAKDGAKAKIKINKSKIFNCLRDGGMKGSIKLTYLFKPSGEIDALGFEPDAPDEVYECVMGILKGEEFPKSTKYYKAIFKYTMK